MKERRKLSAYAMKAMRMVAPTADNAALLTLTAKGSAPWSQMVRARPKKETGGSDGILRAAGTESLVSRYGTVKLLASSVRRTTAKIKRARRETLRTNHTGRRSIKTPT